jgi:hypothetical protein
MESSASAGRDSRAVLTRRSYDPAGALTITGALILLVVRDGEREEQRLDAESSLEHAGGGQGCRPCT